MQHRWCVWVYVAITKDAKHHSHEFGSLIAATLRIDSIGIEQMERCNDEEDIKRCHNVLYEGLLRALFPVLYHYQHLAVLRAGSNILNPSNLESSTSFSRRFRLW